MAIKIQNTTVIDDSRNLVNINSATLFGSTSVTTASAGTTAAVRVKQLGSAPALITRDNTGNVSLVVTSQGRVAMGTEQPATGTLFMLDSSEPILGFAQSGVSVNGVHGWTMREQSSIFSFDRRTSSDFSSFNTVLGIRSINNVSINPQSLGTVPLEVRSSLGLRNSSDEGFKILPSTSPTNGENNVIFAVSAASGNLRGMNVVAQDIRIFTGANTGSTATTRMIILPDGGIGFPTGAVTANQFIETDFFRVTTVSPATGSAVDLALSSTYRHYVLMLNNVYGTQTDSFLQAQLRNDSGAIGPGAYRYSVIGTKTDLSGSTPLASQTANSWILNAYGTSPGGTDLVGGSISGEVMFFNPQTTDRWKRCSGRTTQPQSTTGDTTTAACQSQIGGGVDNTAQANTLRLFWSTGDFAGGEITLYGIRTL